MVPAPQKLTPDVVRQKANFQKVHRMYQRNIAYSPPSTTPAADIRICRLLFRLVSRACIYIRGSSSPLSARELMEHKINGWSFPVAYLIEETY